MHLLGRARDLYTPIDAAPTDATPADTAPAIVLAEDIIHARVRNDRTIVEISSDPSRAELSQLVGARGGGKLRGLLAQVVPDELALGTPLYLLLDDLSGATLVAGFAFSQWPDLMPVEYTERRREGVSKRRMEGICTGFSPGSSALDNDNPDRAIHRTRPVEPVTNPDDPLGWHELPEIQDMSLRRSRRIDVQVSDVIEINAFFQDSCTVPAGGRIAVHEYQIEATASLDGELLALTADPRVLPFAECPLAVVNVDHLLGSSLRELRTTVLERLKGTLGCTHLNDALRALAEVPILADPLIALR
jgi:hypothetical protein